MLLRSCRWLRAQLPFATVVVLMLLCVAYLIVFPGHWRRASGAMAVAMLAAGVLRAVLPSAAVGLLGVRGRWGDTLCYLALGGVILAAAIRLH